MWTFAETRTKTGSKGRHKSFSLFPFLFLHTQNCFLFLIFSFKGVMEGGARLITWLEFTWDKTKDAKKGERERGNERERGGGSDRGIHSWLGFPYHSQHSWIMTTAVIFWDGGQCVAEQEIQGVIVKRNSACVCIRSARDIPSLLSFLYFLQMMFGVKCVLCASKWVRTDVIIQLTHMKRRTVRRRHGIIGHSQHTFWGLS